jgi:hypothetical protein
MACKHERIKSVNCVLYCDICGVKLPDGHFTDHPEPVSAEPVKPAEKAPETAKKTTRKRGTK